MAFITTLLISIIAMNSILNLAHCTPLTTTTTTRTTKDEALSFVFWTEEKGFEINDGVYSSAAAVATASFENKMNQTGWSQLEVSTNGDFEDITQAYGAGYAEGYLTAELIHSHWVNNFENYCTTGDMALVCQHLQTYLTQNSAWIETKIDPTCDSINHHTCDPYWHHVNLFYAQMKGLGQGYRSKAAKVDLPDLSDDQIFFMNIFGDMEDLSQALVDNFQLNGTFQRVMGDGRCSALVKFLPESRDLLVSQVAWGAYNSMTRILKRYSHAFTINGQGEKIPGQIQAFSGYPGIIYSGDDFTVIAPSGLTTLETTIGNSNADLWKQVTPTGSVLEGIRATVANRLATSGQEWTNIFRRYNSGTYNNQWMIVDYTRLEGGIGEKLQEGTFWVLEQLPGLIVSADMTGFLQEETYWASYNSPFFDAVYNASGSPALAQKYGDWFTHDKTPRALIFKRDHKKVTDLESMTKLMRYNDFRHDPLSACNCTPPYSGENAISARCDLNPANGTYPFGALGHRNHGGIDMKLTSQDLFKAQTFVAVSSPTFDTLPPFRWSTSAFADTVPHVGLPDLWNFQPMNVTWRFL